MSITLMAAAWKLPIPLTEKMVLLCLCDYANDHGVCWPAVGTLATKCSCSDRTVQRAIKSLCEAGLLSVNDATGKSHVFQINIGGLVNGTPDTVSPPTMRHPRQSVTPVVTQCHPTPDTVSPKPSITINEPSSKKTPEGADPIGVMLSQVVNDWNVMAEAAGLPKVQTITPARRKAFAARCKEVGGIDPWRKAIASIRESDFLKGKNDRGWKADFDFMLQARSFTRLIEGAYDQKKPSAAGSQSALVASILAKQAAKA